MFALRNACQLKISIAICNNACTFIRQINCCPDKCFLRTGIYKITRHSVILSAYVVGRNTKKYPADNIFYIAFPAHLLKFITESQKTSGMKF